MLETCVRLSLQAFVIGIPYVYYKGISEQVKVKKFIESINREVFEPKGMYFKTQSSSVHIDDYHEVR